MSCYRAIGRPTRIRAEALNVNMEINLGRGLWLMFCGGIAYTLGAGGGLGQWIVQDPDDMAIILADYHSPPLPFESHGQKFMVMAAGDAGGVLNFTPVCYFQRVVTWDEGMPE